MSNRTLKQRIENSVNDYKSGKISIGTLRDSIQLNGNALEMMPYDMLQVLNEIEYNLTVSQWADEDGFLPDMEETLVQIETWLKKVPVESE